MNNNRLAGAFLNGFPRKIISMQLNPYTLSFRDDQEKVFLSKYFADSLVHFRVAFVLVAILYGLFGVLDSVMVPDLREAFMIIRFGIVIPVLLIVLFLSFFPLFKNIWQGLLFLSFIVAGTGISAMLVVVPENHAYYGGLMLVFFAGYFFIKLRFFLAAIAGWFNLIIYNAGAFLLSDAPLELIINNNFFYVSANIIGMFASYNIEYFARRDFFLNNELDKRKEEVEEVNKTLEIKVDERTSQLKEAKERAEQSDKLKSAFLANMSHEIRTPMNGILGFSQLLLEAEDEEERREFVEVINRNGNHLLELINDIIDLSKIEVGMLSVNHSEFSLNALLDEVHNMFKSNHKVLEKRVKLKLRCSLSGVDAVITSDRTRLKQILINLTSNAMKFTSNGFVEIGYTVHKEDLLFYVKDTGTGIPREQQEVIFDRFMQATIDHQPKFEGSGLGLAISKAFVQLLGGEIWVESNYPGGSVFSFTIPFLQGDQSIFKNFSIKPSEMNFNWKNKVILVAEDVATNYLLIKTALRKTDVSLIWAKNGQEALDECKKEQQIDLVLMDVRMPVMDGYTATKLIKEVRPDIPVIAQTSYAMDGDREKSQESGCNDYIAKPFNVNEFLQLIARYL